MYTLHIFAQAHTLHPQLIVFVLDQQGQQQQPSCAMLTPDSAWQRRIAAVDLGSQIITQSKLRVRSVCA